MRSQTLQYPKDDIIWVINSLKYKIRYHSVLDRFSKLKSLLCFSLLWSTTFFNLTVPVMSFFFHFKPEYLSSIHYSLKIMKLSPQISFFLHEFVYVSASYHVLVCCIWVKVYMGHRVSVNIRCFSTEWVWISGDFFFYVPACLRQAFLCFLIIFFLSFFFFYLPQQTPS